MPDRLCATDGSDRQGAADGGYFAPLAAASNMRLTTFRRDGIAVSATVHGLVDGDRVYFRARSRSGMAKCLRHTDAVQVTPCTALGVSTSLPLDAIARPLPGEQARRAAAELDLKYFERHRFSIPLLRRRRRQAVYYELVADDTAGEQDELPEEIPAPLIIKVNASRRFVPADVATPTSLGPACAPPKAHSAASDYTQIITVTMSLPARKASHPGAGR